MVEHEHQAVTWETIRDVMAEVGLADEFRTFELRLKDQMIHSLVDVTNTGPRFLSDAKYHHELHALVQFFVLVLISRPEELLFEDQTKLRVKLIAPVDLPSLTALFDEGFSEARGSGDDTLTVLQERQRRARSNDG